MRYHCCAGEQRPRSLRRPNFLEFSNAGCPGTTHAATLAVPHRRTQLSTPCYAAAARMPPQTRCLRVLQPASCGVGGIALGR